MNSIHIIYFSPTGNTKKICLSIGRIIAIGIGYTISEYDFTTPKKRKDYPSIENGDVVVMGVPVYAGRVPNLMVPWIKEVCSRIRTERGARGVAVVTYGNRHYDDALIELKDLMEEGGIEVVGGAAFVGEHSFSRTLGGGRPNTEDIKEAEYFGKEIAIKYREGGKVAIPGTPKPYKQHYIPKHADGSNNDIRKVKPETTAACIKCGLCVGLCPMGSINEIDPREVNGICVKCCACVKMCPVGAKVFESAAFLYHKHELEETYTSVYRNNELYW